MADIRIRYCANGHTVSDPEAAECPVCHVDMEARRLVASASAPASAAERATGTLWSLLGLGSTLLLIAAVTTSGDDGEGSAALRAILASVGLVCVLIGGVGIGVKLGITAARPES